MMKKITFILVTILLSQSILSQETIVLRTDRDYYIGGEDLWVNIVNLNQENLQTSDLSKVVYLELLNEEFKPVLQQKLRLEDGEVTSLITLPDTISTANYALRAYTRWMRNLDNEPFAYKMISVVNPFARKSLPEGEVIADNQSKDSSLVKSNQSDLQPMLKLNSAAYRNRSKVTLDLSKLSEYNHLTVSVVKSCLLYDEVQPELSKKAESKQSEIIESHKGDILLPEVEGELITGTITNLETGDAVVGEKMMLSFVGDKPIMKFSTTDTSGRFRFVVNKYGKREMVIQPLKLDTSAINYKVNLDPGFSENYPDERMAPLLISKEKVADLNKTIINMQVNTIYSAYREDGSGKDTIDVPPPFYGEAEIFVSIDKFIELPTIEEVIKEIVPYVGLRKHKGEYYFKTFEPKTYYPRDGETLTLVDGVPVKNINSVLAINPEELDHIDLVNLDYYLEEEKLGRLLCFYTRDGNMGAMEFDNRIFRQARECYHPSYTYVSPDYSTKEKKKNRLADYRNVLYFGTVDLSVGNNELEFYTCDDTGDYTVMVEGIDSKGKTYRKSIEFTVR
ncbi:hypothetical protein [Carboxylicivirga caseinilyticus]|uniref:hypothetical protein n=1 Tax=Carboxylicivirga caseinilyticus TaxID=3417572 RepID=UPI003D354CD7|nr:hypothetical protein [Marinilabiliaceae bacterium A049]